MKCDICDLHYYEHGEAELSKCLRQANLRLNEIDKIVKKLRRLY